MLQRVIACLDVCTPSTSRAHLPQHTTPKTPNCSLAARIQDESAWAQLEPHFGAKAAANLLNLLTDGARGGLPSLDGAAGVLSRLPGAAADAAGKLQLRDGISNVKLPTAPALPRVSLPSVSLPELPALPSLPSLPSLPRTPQIALPDHIPSASDLARAVQDGAAAALGAAHQLPAAFSSQLAALEALLASEPGRGATALGLEPHFGTKALETALAQLAAALSAAVGAPGALPPILQLPTGAFDGRLADAAAAVGAAASPERLAAAWGALGQQLAAALPSGAGAAVAAAVAQQQAAAGVQVESLISAIHQLQATAATLPETGYGGFDFVTLCAVASATLLAVAASVPSTDYEASATAPRPGSSAGSSSSSFSKGGGRPADPPLSYEYDPDEVAAYFSRRPLAVATRATQLARELSSFGLALAGDFATGRVKENEPARARQLRGAIERLGPAYVKVAQVRRGLCVLCVVRVRVPRLTVFKRPQLSRLTPFHSPPSEPTTTPQNKALSTRVDLLSPEYFHQIQLLQDRVPPFPCEEAKQVGLVGWRRLASVGSGWGGCSGEVLRRGW